MKYKEIETTQEEVLQSLVDAGIELTPSNTTLGKQLQKLLQKDDEYYTLYMLVDELCAREKSNNSVYRDLHGISWVDLIDMAIALLQKVKSSEQEMTERK